MKKMKLYILVGIIGCLAMGCSDFLEEYSPDKSYVRGYSDLDELLVGEAYMKCHNMIYMGYQSSSEDFYWPYVHYMADETEIVTNSAAGGNGQYGHQYLFGYYCWQEDVTRDFNGDVRWSDTRDWENLYKFINITNTVLSLIDEQEAITDEDKLEVSRIKGEAYFLRGAYYFTLVNLFGQPYAPSTASTDLGVPIKLSEFVEDKVYTRASVQACYDQIVSDLLAAEECLKDVPEESIVRANHTATCLLLSRVYLYMQNYEEALKWAKVSVEAHSQLMDLKDVAAGWDTTDFLEQGSPELIFTMGTNALSANITGYYGEWKISDDLYNSYEDKDLRKNTFIGVSPYFWDVARGRLYGKMYHSDYNYGYNNYISDNFLMRSAESYLNLAEAAACLGGEHTAEALEAYNTLRRNRFPEGYTDVAGVSGKDLVDSVRVERRRELCLEGHRWFDLRRYMVNEQYPYEKTLTNNYLLVELDYATWGYVATESGMYELPPHDPAWTLPIPRSELDINLGMQDNVRGPRESILSSSENEEL